MNKARTIARKDVKSKRKVVTERNLEYQIDSLLLKRAIMNGEELTHDSIMTKREKIISNHINNVYPILTVKDRGKEVYYTKLTPNTNNHAHKISSKNLDDLKQKIIAYYLEIDYREKTTIGDVLEMAIRDLEPLTAVRHRQLLDKYFSSIKDKKLKELSEKDIQDCLSGMIDTGIKAKAFNNATSTLNKINDYCVYHHIECLNIRDAIASFRKYRLVGKHVFISSRKKEKELAFTETEAVTLIRYIFANPDYINLAIAVLLTTGLRAGELLALTPEDVDLDAGMLNVSKMEQNKTNQILDYCKDNSERCVFLNADARRVFMILMDLRASDDSESEFLFLNRLSDDGKLHLRALDNRLRKIQNILGMTANINERSPHDCRRTYASIQYLHGIDIKTIQAQLGHANPQQTWDYIRDIVDNNTRASLLEKGCIL
ncbi:MAG: site-specific integrase [Lachnospiraceae bacterium]|nr:site-specific integrase [Lachnospiraceae bacterium]